VLCEPTAGVDVGARQAIYELIAERADRGLSLVVSSSDTGDLLALCTRVLVMGDGRIVRELSGAEITEQALLSAMEETDQR
jgi:ribose transport system ATP-binding protein